MNGRADEPGVYQLHLLVAKPARLKIGRLGVFLFPAGRYVYTGSALGGLNRRLARHQRAEKRLHWHIDYLLRHARIVRIVALPTQERHECALNRELLAQPGARVLARGFGSSDCRCPAHLVYLEGEEACLTPAFGHPSPPTAGGEGPIPEGCAESDGSV